MPRRELLSPAQRQALLALPTDEAELIRHYTLGADDLNLIRQHRGSNNQLGFAVQLCYLRFPGRSLGVDEAPAPQLLEYIAAQLDVSPETWNEYAMRDQTRREHLQELQRHLGLRFFTAADYRGLAVSIATLAMQTHGLPPTRCRESQRAGERDRDRLTGSFVASGLGTSYRGLRLALQQALLSRALSTLTGT